MQIGHGTPALVFAVDPQRNYLPKHKPRRGLLGSLAEGLAFLRSGNATQADAFWAVIVQDFDGIAVEDRDDFAGESCRDSDTGEQDV